MIRSARSSTTRLLYKLCTSPKMTPPLYPPQPLCPSPITAILHLRRFSDGRTAGVKEVKETWWNESTEMLRNNGNSGLLRGQRTRQCIVSLQSRFLVTKIDGPNTMIPCFARSFASKASKSTSENSSETRKDISTVEDPFDAPTYNIPEKPMTFTEGASYSVIILAGLGIAAAAGYAVFKELIFEPKEYKVFGKALRRIQDDNQVSARIGSPITGYGQESRNRAARQRIPSRSWKDDDGVEHVEVNFYIRGPHGGGKVFTEMFKDKVDKQWKFIYLLVEIQSPSPARILLESYLPA